jgi:hypothetical protein
MNLKPGSYHRTKQYITTGLRYCRLLTMNDTHQINYCTPVHNLAPMVLSQLTAL